MPAAAAHARHPRALPFVEPPGYAQRRPENTLLYQLVGQRYPAFREMRATPTPGLAVGTGAPACSRD